jgi:hypothetical protein
LTLEGAVAILSKRANTKGIVAMQAFRVETTIQEDGVLTVNNLPLPAGAAVEVIILPRPSATAASGSHPLRGLPVDYRDPTMPVAEADWEVFP